MALKELIALSADKIIIKKADKGNTLIVMDQQFYRDKLVLQDHLQTSTYRTADIKSDVKVFKNLKTLMDKHRSCLTNKEFKYITEYEWSTSNFYVLPKIHKCKSITDKISSCHSDCLKLEAPPDLKGRPIVGGPQSPTQHLSEFLEKLLSPLVPHLKSFVKDDWDYLRKLPRYIDPSYKLFSCDIVSLYTSIRHDLGLTALAYWMNELRHLIPTRITSEFVIESADFILRNNFFLFDDVMYLQLIGTAMGTIFAPPYSCLTIGYLEVIKLYPAIRLHFPITTAKFIEDNYKRYMDDGTTPLPPDVDPALLLNILNSLDKDIKFTLEEAVHCALPNGHSYQHLSFLDIQLILHDTGVIETDVFYKTTNNHDYLSYYSHHPQHVKDNIPYNLAKRIIVFCSNSEVESRRLSELRNWLNDCNSPPSLIDKKFRNAKLQGPAPQPEDKNSITYVTTNFSNYDVTNISSTSKSLLRNSHNGRVNEVFENCDIVTAYRQPPNLLRRICKSKFSSTPHADSLNAPGFFKCNGNRCQLCQEDYIQEGEKFITSNGKEWIVRNHIDCNSINVIYYLICNACKKTTYCGKTNCLRKRLNNHKSSCLSGKSSDIFDNHVFNCIKISKQQPKPLFLVHAFMQLNDERNLLSYENHLHLKSVDTLNAPQHR